MDGAALDVDDAAGVDAGELDLGADRERAARAGRGLDERVVAVRRLVDREARDRAGRPVDELGEDADRTRAIVVDEERRPRARELERAGTEAVLAAGDDADLVVGDDDALDRARA